jgi:hypothetical protein
VSVTPILFCGIHRAHVTHHVALMRIHTHTHTAAVATAAAAAAGIRESVLLYYIYAYLPNFTTSHHTTLHHITPCHTSPHHTTLHYTTMHYSTLHHTTLHCIALHHTTLHCTTPHYTALHYTSRGGVGMASAVPTETYADLGGVESIIQDVSELVAYPLTHPGMCV